MDGFYRYARERKLELFGVPTPNFVCAGSRFSSVALTSVCSDSRGGLCFLGAPAGGVNRADAVLMLTSCIGCSLPSGDWGLLLQLRVFRFGLAQHGHVRVSILPQRQEILIGSSGFGLIASHGIGTGDAKMRQRMKK